jgi:hypothetical protein
LEVRHCRLEIIDAEALAEQLAEPGLFWIAEEYLHIPAELFPTTGHDADSAYGAARRRWIEEDHHPSSFADFIEIKLGVRKSTFNEQLRPDLSRWISKMEAFIEPGSRSDLEGRASYEICVAALRGQHNLTPRRPLVEKYFETWAKGNELAELRDAAILLSYASSAVLRGEFEIEPSRLFEWSKTLVVTVNLAMSKATGPNALADLLYTRSTVANLPFQNGPEPHYAPEGAFRWWSKMVTAAAKAPLFPVEEFSDLLTGIAEFYGDDPKYRAIVQKVDSILENRSKGYLVAEKSRDRAVELMRVGKTVAAIQELHKAKVRWFTGDTLEGTLLAMLSLSQAYLKLGLVWAAKYHAFGAAFVIAKSNDDDVRARLGDAICQLGDCAYAGGEWATFSELVPLYFVTHYEHVQDPDDWGSHVDMQRIVFHFLLMRSIGRALGGQLAVDLVEQPFLQLDMPEDLRAEVLSPPLPLEQYETLDPTEVANKASRELWGKPFADCGPERTYIWRALGITWSATCPNTLDTVPYVEEFVAVLQIAIADLAHVDLCLLPTSVDMRVMLADVDHVGAEHTPDNSRLSFAVKLPRKGRDGLDNMHESQSEVLVVVAMLLAACSCLPDPKFEGALTNSLKQGLSGKTFLVRPYYELFREFTSKDGFDARRSTPIGGHKMSAFQPRQSVELGWIDRPGPGYSKAKAEQFIANRYRRALAPIRVTVERLKMSERFQGWVARMRSEGMRDWQILLLMVNSVLNFKAHMLGLDRDPARFKEFSRAFMESEEAVDAPVFPEDKLIEDHGSMMRMTTLATNAKVWGLTVRRQTPDFVALKQLLDIRYGQAVDDIPHEDFLGT